MGLIPVFLLIVNANAELVVRTERVSTSVTIRADQSSASTQVGSLSPGESLEWIRNIYYFFGSGGRVPLSVICAQCPYLWLHFPEYRELYRQMRN